MSSTRSFFLKKSNENYQELKKKSSLCSLGGPSPGTAPSPPPWGLRHMSLTLSFLVAPGDVYSRCHAWADEGTSSSSEGSSLKSAGGRRGRGRGPRLTVLELVCDSEGRKEVLSQKRESCSSLTWHLWRCPEGHMEGG